MWENIAWNMFVEYFKLLNNPEHKEKMITSFVDEMEDFNMSFICKTNLKLLKNKSEKINIKEVKKNIYQLSFNHKDLDAMGIVQLFYDKNLNNIKINDFFLHNYYPTKNLFYFPVFVKNYYHDICYKKSTNILHYDHKILPIKSVKQKMEKLQFNNTTNFLFAILILQFFKETDCSFAKVANIFYMPWVKGNVKVMKIPFIIQRTLNIHEIYKQIEENKLSILDGWGIYYWSNFYKTYLEFTNSSNKKQVIKDDIVISNIPLSFNFDYLKITLKEKKRAPVYVFGIGNKNKDINLSFCIDSSLKNYITNLQI